MTDQQDKKRSYFWPSFWSGIGWQILISVVLELIPAMANSEYVGLISLVILALIGRYLNKKYGAKFNVKGFVLSVFAGLILSFIIVGLFAALLLILI